MEFTLENFPSAKMYRQYSITCRKDAEDIENGRCPSYAVNWSSEENQQHWPEGHDYYMGKSQNDPTNNVELRQILSERLTRTKSVSTSKIIFCDLDGVLADFDQQVIDIFHKPPSEISPALLWGTINKSSTFFEDLPWTPRGKELWEQIRHYDPIILTGVPPQNKTAAQQKRAWVARELGPHVPVITCLSKNKPKYCLTNSILIDDMDKNKEEWTLNRGLFLHYHEDKLEEIVDKINEHMQTL